jgi:adenylate cyclase
MSMPTMNMKILRLLSSPLPCKERLAPRGPVASTEAEIALLSSFIEGSNSILDARNAELAIISEGQQRLSENSELSRRLTKAVDRLVLGAKQDIMNANREALSAQQFSTGVLIALVAMSLVSSVLIVWLYVDRNLIARLTALSRSMLAIADGNLETSLPAAGRDEIGRMARALAIFRDTAVEVKKNNLREITEARRSLIAAIESISEGFSLYDANDRLVICNSNYTRIMYPGIEAAVTPGMSFEAVIRRAVERGLVGDAEGRVEEWVAERLARHRGPGGVSFAASRRSLDPNQRAQDRGRQHGGRLRGHHRAEAAREPTGGQI